uniref:Uncharacterized protein n=1 Tax=viral metagenome TaxID=1070528 RepID=A0A6C0EG30_9ZZZZ
MDKFIEPVTGTIIDETIKIIKKKKNREKIMSKIIDPLLCDLTTRYYPHIITIIGMLIIIVLLLIVLLVIVLLDKNSE